MGPVYYCPGQPYKIISSGELKFYAGFEKVTSKPIEHCDFVDPQGRPWVSPYQNQNNLEYIQIEIVKVKPQRDRNVFSQLSVHFQNKISLSLFISVLFMYLLPH